MEKQLAQDVVTILNRLLDTRFTYRSFNSLTNRGDLADVLDFIRDTFDLEVVTRRADGESLYGLFNNDKVMAKGLVALLTALMDSRFQLRSADTLASIAGISKDDVADYAAGFDFVSKTRRADGAQLYGLSN